MNLGTTPAASGAPALFPLERQQAIENALSMALHYVRTGDSPAQLHKATAKARRALTLLKHAHKLADESSGRA